MLAVSFEVWTALSLCRGLHGEIDVFVLLCWRYRH